MTRYHVTISSDDRELMLDLVRKLKVQVFDHGVRQTPEEGYIVHALVEDQDISALAAKGYKISRNYDVDNVGILRQAEVGKMNRYIKTVDKAMDLSAGILTKFYLNIHEVESALEQAAASPNTTFTELITLPNPTREGRQSQAIKLGNRSNPDRIGVYFLGGVHAREWGSSDILVNFIESVSKSYRNNTGLSLGGKDFAASEIQSLINKLDIIIFPQVNHDGRNHSMTSDAMWRKNRRPAPPDHPGCIGVDLNRNYNFLWNYPLYFSRDAGVHSSIDPCDYELYIGPGAASEPETQNVVYIMDNNSHFRSSLIYTSLAKIFCIVGEIVRIKQLMRT
jgi:murein tripeptide amidase MpaA